jgi:hypothetical protein
MLHKNLTRVSRSLHPLLRNLTPSNLEGKAVETLYVVQGFYGVGQGMVSGKPILHGMEQLARARGEALAGQCDGVLVYAQGADADRDEYSAPVILAKYGDVPHPEAQSLRQPVPEVVHEHAPWWGLSGFGGTHAQAS